MTHVTTTAPPDLSGLPRPVVDVGSPAEHALGRWRAAFTLQWLELGRIGRIAMLGLVVSAALSIVLGFSIQAAARGHLLEARSQVLEEVVGDLQRASLLPLDTAWSPGLAPLLHEQVEHRLLGGDTVRLKLWAPDGTIVYSDVDELIGRRFGLGANARAALAGVASVAVTRPTDAENRFERELGPLLEFYLPVTTGAGEVIGLVEIYQDVAVLDDALAGIRRNIWLSIGTGLLVVAVVMTSLTGAQMKAIDGRRRHAQRLFQALLRAEDHERRRVVGILHDDVGQPMYRLLYGLEATQARLEPGDPVRAEVQHLAGLVRDVETTLRAELQRLHRGQDADLGIGAALTDLAHAIADEADLDVQVDVPGRDGPSAAERTVLFRAAQEAVTNVRKHADASTVALRLRRDRERWVLEVDDDGKGIDGPEGLGLATTRERLVDVGGGLDVRRRRGGGTRFRAWVPAGTTRR